MAIYEYESKSKEFPTGYLGTVHYEDEFYKFTPHQPSSITIAPGGVVHFIEWIDYLSTGNTIDVFNNNTMSLYNIDTLIWKVLNDPLISCTDKNMARLRSFQMPSEPNNYGYMSIYYMGYTYLTKYSGNINDNCTIEDIYIFKSDYEAYVCNDNVILYKQRTAKIYVIAIDTVDHVIDIQSTTDEEDYMPFLRNVELIGITDRSVIYRIGESSIIHECDINTKLTTTMRTESVSNPFDTRLILDIPTH